MAPLPEHRCSDEPRTGGSVIQLGAAGAAAVGRERGVSGPTASDDDPTAGRRGTGKAPAWDVHVGEALPAVVGESEVEAVGIGGG